MTKQEVYEMLKSKGFDTFVFSDGVVASLRRYVSTMEIKVALDYKVEDFQVIQFSENEVGVICME